MATTSPHSSLHVYQQPDDMYERVKEGVVRTIVAGWLPGHSTVNHNSSRQHHHDNTHWINPNEVCTI